MKSRIKLENQGKEPAEQKQKIQIEIFKQKGHRLQRNFDLDIMEDLQEGRRRPHLRWPGSSFNVVKRSFLQSEKEKQTN